MGGRDGDHKWVARAARRHGGDEHHRTRPRQRGGMWVEDAEDCRRENGRSLAGGRAKSAAAEVHALPRKNEEGGQQGPRKSNRREEAMEESSAELLAATAAAGAAGAGRDSPAREAVHDCARAHKRGGGCCVHVVGLTDRLNRVGLV